MIDLEAKVDRPAADLAVLDVAGGAGAGVELRLEALAAIRALDRLELNAAGAVRVFGRGNIDDWLETVARIDAVRISLRGARLRAKSARVPAGTGPFHQ